MSHNRREAHDSSAGIDVWLDASEQRNWREFYAGLTERVVFIGDSSLRTTTVKDRIQIAQIRTLADSGNSEDTVKAQENLKTIIAGGGQHSLLSKAEAIFAYCDIAHQNNHWGKDFLTYFSEVLLTEPEIKGHIILAGALYARLTYLLSSTPEGQQILQQVDQYLSGTIDSKQKAQNKLGIHAAAGVFARLIRENKLQMRLPLVFISSNKNDFESRLSLGGGYPDKTMILATGYLPSENKLKEAAIMGMPEITSKLPIRRLPRVLIGVELTKKAQSRMKSAKFQEIRSLLHIYLRPLRKPKMPADLAFATEDLWTWDEVYTSASFDSLSYWVAVRLARDLEERFKDVAHLRGKDREDQKRVITQQNMVKWISFLEKPLVNVNEETLSILKLALQESQRYDGKTNWGISEARSHLIYSAQALALFNHNGALRIRPESEINTLYLRNAWEHELTTDDKIELFMALLEVPNSRYWHLVPVEYHQELVQSMYSHIALSEKAKRMLVSRILNNDNVWPKFLVFHCETIRDIIDPDRLKELNE